MSLPDPSPDAARFLRQVLLPEIGEAGQARIGRGTARVMGQGLAHEVAELYARRAGLGLVTDGAIDRGALAPADIVARGAPREVLAGARAALLAIRASLAAKT